jgi:hypothetical protein
MYMFEKLNLRHLLSLGFTSLMFLLHVSCIKEDVSNISDKVLMHQSFSVPLGLKEVVFDKPSISDTSSIPGMYGSYYYDNRIYPNNVTYFTKTYDIPFTLRDRKEREEWIKRIVFHLLIENNFPTTVYSQVYIYNANGMISDSVFVNGQVLVEAAKVSSLGEVEQSSAKIFDVPFEGSRLEMLKQTTLLVYKGVIQSENGLKLSEKNDVKINIALQAELEYSLNEL